MEEFVISKILITGGAGFIGSNLAKKLSKENSIVIVDDLSMGRIENINNLKNITFYKESISNYEFIRDLLLNEDFDYIFHLAAIASVADSINRPIEANEINFLSTLNMLNILKEMKNSSLKRLIFSSSAAVYGDNPVLPKTEDSNVNPLSPYAIDKFAAEKYVLVFNSLYGLPTTCVRFFNVYGPNQNPSSPYSGVISILTDIFEKTLRGIDVEFNLYGDGKQSRDFVYVEDVVQALVLVAKSNEAIGNVYNVGTGVETSLKKIIEVISGILKTKINIKFLDERTGDIKHSVSSIEKLKELNYKPKYTIEEGLEKYIEFLNMNNS